MGTVLLKFLKLAELPSNRPSVCLKCSNLTYSINTVFVNECDKCTNYKEQNKKINRIIIGYMNM